MKLSEALTNSSVSAIVYGESGIGKTYFAGTLPGKTLIVAVEANGIKTLANSKNAANIEVCYLPAPTASKEETIAKWNTFFDSFLVKEIPFDNVVLDSATELANALLLLKADPNKNGGTPTMKNYSEVQFTMKRWLRIMRDVAEIQHRNVIITALEAELVLAQSEDSQTSKTHPALSGKKLSPEAEGLYDIVAHLEKKSDGSRYFRLEGNEQFVAKDRLLHRSECPADGAILLNIKTSTNTKEK